jgi:hypothetical protein
MNSLPLKLVMLGLLAAAGGCEPKPKAAAAPPPAPPPLVTGLLKVGSIIVEQADLDYQLKENHGGRNDAETRQTALKELASRAQFAQAALDADLARDPVVRAEIARVLVSHLKEKSLTPQLKAAAATPIPESRLRELYAAGESRFRSDEKRQVAVLWLNPNGDPQRAQQYTEKLTAARDWLAGNGDLKDHPAQGFAVLSVDHSEHAPSRFKGGVVGWLERAGGMDAWTKAVAEIAFSLKDPGEVSPVVSRPEGLFLVRYMAQKAAVLRPFEAVSGELEKAERHQLRNAAEKEFERAIQQQYPVQWQHP